MIALEFTDAQGCAIAAAAQAFGVTFREMAEHAVWFKVSCRLGSEMRHRYASRYGMVHLAQEAEK